MRLLFVVAACGLAAFLAVVAQLLQAFVAAAALPVLVPFLPVAFAAALAGDIEAIAAVVFLHAAAAAAIVVAGLAALLAVALVELLAAGARCRRAAVRGLRIAIGHGVLLVPADCRTGHAREPRVGPP